MFLGYGQVSEHQHTQGAAEEQAVMVLRMGGGVGASGCMTLGLLDCRIDCWWGKLDSELFAEFLLGMTGMISFMLLG